eukprot:SAG11_NODE_36704_length_260_cov_0.881988_1_plen_55_part_10
MQSGAIARTWVSNYENAPGQPYPTAAAAPAVAAGGAPLRPEPAARAAAEGAETAA